MIPPDLQNAGLVGGTLAGIWVIVRCTIGLYDFIQNGKGESVSKKLDKMKMNNTLTNKDLTHSIDGLTVEIKGFREDMKEQRKYNEEISFHLKVQTEHLRSKQFQSSKRE